MVDATRSPVSGRGPAQTRRLVHPGARDRGIDHLVPTRYDRRDFLERAGRLPPAAPPPPPPGPLAPTGPWSAPAVTADPRLRELERAVQGAVVAPGSPGYAQSRLLVNTRFDAVTPLAIVYCLSVADVQATIRWARRHGVRIAARAGGHSYGGYSTTEGVVVDVTRLNG